jgi:DNA-binding SARP family transcriptional activator
MSYRTLLQNDDFREFVDEIRDRLKDQIAITRTESDTVKLFRAQGAAEALESLLEYPEEQAISEQRESEETREGHDEG